MKKNIRTKKETNTKKDGKKKEKKKGTGACFR